MKLNKKPHRRHVKNTAFNRNPAMVMRPHKPKPPRDDKPRPPRPPFAKWVAAHHRWDYWKKDWIVVQGHWIKRNIRAALDIVTPARTAAKFPKKSLLLLEAEKVIELALREQSSPT